MASSPDAPAIPKRRCYALTPGKFLWAMLLMQGVLFLSSRYYWFWFNERKGYTVLIASAATAIGLLFLGIAVLMSRFTPWKAQFGVAAVLWIVVLVAVPCGWLTREFEADRRQRTVVAGLANRRAYISYQEGVSLDDAIQRRFNTQSRRAITTDKKRTLMQYLESTLGRDFFRDVFSISVMEADGETLEILSELVQLQELDVQVAAVTNDDMKHLRRLTLLKTLNLRGSSSGSLIGDEGVKPLRGLTRLEELHLVDVDVTDAGLVHLKGLKRLKSLRIDCHRITDEGLLHIAELKGLTSLRLLGGTITDEGVEKLRESLPKCKIVATPYR